MSDSGRQIGDCKHANAKETCKECAPEPINLDSIRTDVLIALRQLRKSLEAGSVEAIDECTKAAIHYLERVKEALEVKP